METRDFIKKLNKYFETIVEIPRIKVGKRQTIETLMNEEALVGYQISETSKREMGTTNSEKIRNAQ